ncbi:hypothetical protein RM543_10800 [Roseicyclus sp. F158]|uniref:Uncharacterized protein n=1 Tax=Tropicimonas omnivorans TaxID=3075590 RepID=A0ABU3DHI2_9RHOB|nr:hypothetical protein [Roseicyclus sp. F158]MDT0683176.1 hypothetical protein [Roseicyclus sp. F158]
MRQFPLSGAAALALWAILPVAASGQTAADPASADGFASENAVLDTSIPFAIGAREAMQELRGAFGWPTFQEGLVGGVYFRFDPDGYARFAPTPRLDTDIFEVVCRPRTLSCMGRKGPLSVFLNGRGQFEIKLDGVQEGDTLHLAEGVSEIQLPEQVLMPLTAQLETLLGSGGELVRRRDGEEQARVSLTGVGAVFAYLRWVAAKQDYTVLPRDWPVPNAAGLTDAGRLTKPQSWASPMPQPQTQPMLPVLAMPTAAPDPAGSEVAEVRGELNLLRELLLQRSAEAAASPAAPPAAAPPAAAQADLPSAPAANPAAPQTAAMLAPPPADPAPHGGLASLEARIIELQRQLNLGRMDAIGVPLTPADGAAEPASSAPGDALEAVAEEPVPENAKMVEHLSYLMTEIGLDPQMAVMLLQMQVEGADTPAMSGADPAATDLTELLTEIGIAAPLPGTDDVVTGEADPAPADPAMPPAAAVLRPVSPAEYELLTDYFKSVFPPTE